MYSSSQLIKKNMAKALITKGCTGPPGPPGTGNPILKRQPNRTESKGTQ